MARELHRNGGGIFLRAFRCSSTSFFCLFCPSLGVPSLRADTPPKHSVWNSTQHRIDLHDRPRRAAVTLCFLPIRGSAAFVRAGETRSVQPQAPALCCVLVLRETMEVTEDSAVKDFLEILEVRQGLALLASSLGVEKYSSSGRSSAQIATNRSLRHLV